MLRAALRPLAAVLASQPVCRDSRCRNLLPLPSKLIVRLRFCPAPLPFAFSCAVHVLAPLLASQSPPLRPHFTSLLLPHFPPSLQHLLDKPQALFALVLSPTRELAIQIAEQFEALGAGIGVKCAVLVGGIDMMAQVRTGSLLPGALFVASVCGLACCFR